MRPWKMASSPCEDCVLEDIKVFIAKFLEKETHQFSDFILLWNELNFVHLYCIPGICGDKNASTSYKTLTELTHKLLQVGLDHMTHGDDITASLVGLYLLYAVYFTQPLEVKVHIRVTVKKWSDVDKVLNHYKQNKMGEAVYLLSCLKTDQAFLLCHTSCQMFLTERRPDSCSVPEGCRPSSRQYLDTLAAHTHTLMAKHTEHKQSLSLYLPPHLLEHSPLPGHIDRIMKEEFPPSKST